MPLTTRGRAEATRTALAASAGCLFAIVVAAATWLLVERQRLAAEMARYGEALAEDVALLAVEPLRREDRIGLGLAVARLVERREVRGIAVYTRQGQPFVAAGNIASPQAPIYGKRVLAESAAIGQARVALNPASFRPTPTSHLIAGAVALATLLIVFGAGSVLARYWSTSESGRGAARTTASTTAEEDDDGTAETRRQPQAADYTRYGVVANLFHRASMSSDDRRSALLLALEAAQGAAELYGGEAAPLARVGAVMTFAGSEERRAFDAVCAALVLRDVLEAPAFAASGLFRYGVDSIPAPPDDVEQGRRDLLLLASLAPNGELAIGKDVHAALAPAGALEIAPLDNRAVRALAPTTPRGVVHAVGDKRHAALLARQAAEIAAALRRKDVAPPPAGSERPAGEE